MHPELTVAPARGRSTAIVAAVLVFAAMAAALVTLVVTPARADDEVAVIAGGLSSRKAPGVTFTDVSTILEVSRPGITIRSVEFPVEGSLRQVGEPMVVRQLPAGSSPLELAGYPPRVPGAVPAVGARLATNGSYVLLIGMQTLAGDKGRRGALTIRYSVPNQLRIREVTADGSMTVCLGAVVVCADHP